MANIATVSFKLSPDQYTVLKALAASVDQSVSEFVRETVTDHLELDRKVIQMGIFLQGAVRESESEYQASTNGGA